MRASMRADGTTSDPAATEDLDGRERPGGGQHKDEVGVETTTDSATKAYENYLCPLGGPELLKDFVEQREWRKHVH